MNIEDAATATPAATGHARAALQATTDQAEAAKLVKIAKLKELANGAHVPNTFGT